MPDADEQGPREVPGGLAPCVLHHRAFDSDPLAVRPNGMIARSGRLRAEQAGPLLEVGLKRYDGESIRMPRRAEERPGRHEMEERWERLRLAS